VSLDTSVYSYMHKNMHNFQYRLETLPCMFFILTLKYLPIL